MEHEHDEASSGATATTPATCSGCGAAVARLICPFCGREIRALRTLEDEREALLELHESVRQAADDEAKRKLLTGAWVPTRHELLVEAGLQCLPLIEDSQVLDRPAVLRLDAIATRLRVSGPVNEAERRALAEFEARVKRFDRASRRLDIVMSFTILGILGFVVFGVWSCTHR
ncbi:MAG: hypothetical protein U0169_24900 [Polyangiaceae bacterium]